MKGHSYCTAILPAAGVGSRMGTDTKKQFLTLEGKEVIVHTLLKFEQCKGVDAIVLVTGRENISFLQEVVKREGFEKVHSIVAGGKERQDSVYAGLCAMPEETEIVAVHDGVRPFISVEDIEKTIVLAEKKGGCALGVKTKDTIQICNEKQEIVKTPDRKFVWCIQTPQTFRKSILLDAFQKARQEGFLGTDEAALVQRAGYTVFVAEGSYSNIKITTPEDLKIGSLFLQREVGR